MIILIRNKNEMKRQAPPATRYEIERKVFLPPNGPEVVTIMLFFPSNVDTS